MSVFPVLGLLVAGKSIMLLSQRNPSLSWEPIAVDPTGQYLFWAWFRPIAIPSGVIFSVPAVLFLDARISSTLSLRRLVVLTGLDPSQIVCWVINGVKFDVAGATSVLLDQPLPAPTNGIPLEVSVWFAVTSPPVWPVLPIPTAAYSPPLMGQPVPGNVQAGHAGFGAVAISQEDQQLLDAIESNWKDVLALEVRVATLRKEIGGNSSRLSTLNRDLSSHERLACTQKDLGEWSDCRRALRDAMTVMARSVKEIDLGTTSGAGRRHQFEEIHENYVLPRRSFPGIQQALNEFETYRKILHSVIGAAQASLSRGGREAEMRASAFLQRIHAKAMQNRKSGKHLFSKSFPPPE